MGWERQNSPLDEGELTQVLATSANLCSAILQSQMGDLCKSPQTIGADPICRTLLQTLKGQKRGWVLQSRCKGRKGPI